MRRILKKIGAAAAVLLAMLVIALAYTGLPPPPAVEAENVPRVPWKWTWRLASTIRQMNGLTYVRAWLPDGDQMLIGTGLAGRIRLLVGPGTDPDVMPELPDYASDFIIPDHASADYFVFSVDEGGSERYIHYVYDRSEQSVRRLTSEPARSYLCCFDPDAGRIAYSSARRNGEDFDIYIIDLGDPLSEELVYLADGAFFAQAWSPDGRHIAVIEILSHSFANLHLLDVETRQMRRLLPELGEQVSFASPTWSPDSQSLFFTSNFETEFRQLYRYDLSTGRASALSAGIPWDVIDLELTPDGEHLVMLVNEDGIPVPSVVDLPTGHVDRVDNAPPGYLSGMRAHPGRDVVAFNVTAAAGVPNVHVLDLDTGQWTAWTQPAFDESRLPPVSVVHYPTFDVEDGDSRVISAFVFRPAEHYSGPRPVLIHFHGGPAQQARPTLNPIHNNIRQAGVTIIAPNVRGSSGYGKTFEELDNGTKREDAIKDAGALLDWIARQPDLDAERIGVEGGSYGGFMVLASLARYSDRLRCGAEQFGISNLVTYLNASKDSHFVEAQRAEFGDERDPKTRAFLESISPVYQAANISVPVLIFQGVNDVRVKPEESRQMVANIRANGGTVHYVEAANEGHSMNRPWNMLYFGAAGMHILEECLLN